MMNRPPLNNTGQMGGIRQPMGTMASPPMPGGNRMPTPPNMGGQMFNNQNSNNDVSSSGPTDMLRKQLEQPGSGMGVIRPNNSHLAAQLGAGGNGAPPPGVVTSQAQGGPQGGGGSSLLLSQLAKQTTSDPNPDVINQVATCHASKIPNNSLQPLMPNKTGPHGTLIKEELDIKQVKNLL